jgi:putative thiamine transport system substrate-binding protein
MRTIALLASIGFVLSSASAFAADTWEETLAKAKGQTVYWNAWGGDERTNAFIAWAGEQVKARYGVSIQQVKLTDTAEAVTRVIAEKAAGKLDGGSVDLIWINGPNFLSMKEKGLLHGPFVADLPNARFLDLTPASAASVDFTVPVEGYESPWRLAKFVFNYDTNRIPEPPRSMKALLDWAKDHPGRFTHPDVSNFMGATFLKQALIELTPDASVLQKPATDANFAAATAPLWSWYDALRTNLWQKGKTFPANGSAQQQLLNDGEIDISMSFDPASAAAAIAEGQLPDTVRTYALDGGTIGNISFVAIPFNAAHKEAAEVVADFLLEPKTQAHAQDIGVLGSFSVLDHQKLGEKEKALFAALPTSPALPSNEELGKTQLEPHASWMTRLAEEWAKRYTK